MRNCPSINVQSNDCVETFGLIRTLPSEYPETYSRSIMFVAFPLHPSGVQLLACKKPENSASAANTILIEIVLKKQFSVISDYQKNGRPSFYLSYLDGGHILVRM